MCRQWRCKNSRRVPLDGLTIVSWQVLYLLGMPQGITYSRGTLNCWIPLFQALPKSAPQLLHKLQVPLQLLLWWQLLELCIGARHWFRCISPDLSQRFEVYTFPLYSGYYYWNLRSLLKFPACMVLLHIAGVVILLDHPQNGCIQSVACVLHGGLLYNKKKKYFTNIIIL